MYAHYGAAFQDTSDKFDVDASRRWGRAYRWYFRKWLPSAKNASILEVGCGWGKLLHLFSALGYGNALGIDLSANQVNVARQIALNVELADGVEWLRDKSAQFDLIVSLDVIEHMKKDEVLVFLERCVHALKPGGRLVLQTPNADSPFGLQHRYNDLTHELAFNPNLLGRLLRQAGLVGIEAREQEPVPLGYSLTSSFRFVLWRALRATLMMWNLVETGATGKVLTRVFLVSGIKPRANELAQ
jgi:SAM-dependent methyltransferase